MDAAVEEREPSGTRQAGEIQLEEADPLELILSGPHPFEGAVEIESEGIAAKWESLGTSGPRSGYTGIDIMSPLFPRQRAASSSISLWRCESSKTRSGNRWGFVGNQVGPGVHRALPGFFAWR